MDIKSFISKYKNHPVLFIGTGFSLRYLENSFSWEGLLKYISYELTGNEEYFLDLKSKFQKEDKSYSFEKIATELEILFNEKLSLDRNGKFKEVNDIFYENMSQNKNVSRFKIFISKILSEINLREEKKDEISALIKIRKNISSVITTNYDKLVETLFEFNPLIGNNILLSNPYGSVYKIHGCISEPDMIIMSEKDYQIFDKKYELIRAQLLSLFIHNPIIFIGYSVNDENIRNLLKTIFTYVPVNSDLAEKIKSNFLLIEYDSDSSNLTVNDNDIVLDNTTTLRINKIKTNDFISIYGALASLQLPVSAMDIRKVQSVVKDIYEGGEIQVSIVGDINALKNDEKILAIGDITKIKYEYQNTSEMMENYFKIIEEDNSQLLELIDKHKIQSNQFFPIFGFAKINSSICCTEILKKQQIKKLKSAISTRHKTNKRSLDEIKNDTLIPISGKIDAITYATIKGQLDLSEVEKYLKEFTDKQNTKYRKVLCAYDFMKYKEYDSEHMQTLSIGDKS